VIVVKKKDDQLINSLYKKLNMFKKEGLIITKKEVEEFFYLLINKD
tara:strand:- start:577 stop:714 length:138 start_codon:yes stop_codon:yes gene_type:complete